IGIVMFFPNGMAGLFQSGGRESLKELWRVLIHMRHHDRPSLSIGAETIDSSLQSRS
ncbi:MAG: hypothetical protein RLZZ226_1470, partial [Pseudomonadota bacterium]